MARINLTYEHLRADDSGIDKIYRNAETALDRVATAMRNQLVTSARAMADAQDYAATYLAVIDQCAADVRQQCVEQVAAIKDNALGTLPAVDTATALIAELRSTEKSAAQYSYRLQHSKPLLAAAKVYADTYGDAEIKAAFNDAIDVLVGSEIKAANERQRAASAVAASATRAINECLEQGVWGQGIKMH